MRICFFLKCNLDHILFIFIHSVIKCKFQRSPILRLHGPPVRPRPHVSGDFCIRKFFYADTKISASTRSVYESYTTVHTYPIRIRTSQRISQQSMENLARKKTGSDTVTSAYTKNLRIRASTRIRIRSVYRNFHSGERIQKSPDTCGPGLIFPLVRCMHAAIIITSL